MTKNSTCDIVEKLRGIYLRNVRFPIFNKELFKSAALLIMSRKRPSQPGFTHIKDILDQIICNCHISEKAEFVEIQRIWKHCLGNTAANHAIPASLKNGILLIHAKSPTIIQQLRYQSRDILKQINQTLGEDKISGIRFKIR